MQSITGSGTHMMISLAGGARNRCGQRDLVGCSYSDGMRVIAGDLKGRRLVSPAGMATRPTTDKVREATFNALGSLGLIRDATVADLFAGSGAVGIEALSRGAESCVFIERDRAALNALRDNVAALDCEERSRVVAGDVMALAASLDVDLIYADPPYGFEAWERLLSVVKAPFVVTESGHELSEELGAPFDLEIVRSQRYGRTWVTFWERLSGED
jgi:16S rRNA (guanine966-N2)-methyltransferase